MHIEKVESLNDSFLQRKQSHALHNTSLIFLIDLTPIITKANFSLRSSSLFLFILNLQNLMNSKNPVLHKITEHLIEEASTEEEELLGLEASSESITEQTDPELIRVLDRLILYLRIVHSVDYYNHCEYPYEDEMPNRCGIMHARSGPPINKVQYYFFNS